MWMFTQNWIPLFTLLPKVNLISQKIMKKLIFGFLTVSLHHLCFNTTPGFYIFFLLIFLQVPGGFLLPSEAPCPA